MKLAQLKPLVRERDRGCCVVCGLFVGFEAADGEVHHRRYRSRGGRDEMCNLILTCLACHLPVIHEGDAIKALQNGWAVSRYGAGPELIPVTYPDGQRILLSNEEQDAA